MVGFFIAYSVIAALVAKNVASSLTERHFAQSWFGAFKAVFIAAFALLWLGDATLW